MRSTKRSKSSAAERAARTSAVPPEQLEALRKEFLPSRVRLLFVGEAPPASGRFFYSRNSGLYRAIRDAYRAVDASLTEENFLERFRGSGAYLYDLCRDPVDQLPRKYRRLAHQQARQAFTEILATMQPLAIATLLHSIEDEVEKAVADSEWQGKWIRLPYPGRWQQWREAFNAKLVPELRCLWPQEASESGGADR